MKRQRQRNVLPFDALPSRIPVWGTAVIWLLLDRLQPPSWVWGAAGLFVVMGWIGWAITITQEVQRPLDGYGKERQQ